jgi:hypothetical protein
MRCPGKFQQSLKLIFFNSTLQCCSVDFNKINGNCALESLSPDISAVGIDFQDKGDRRGEEGGLFIKAIDVEGRQRLCNVVHFM